MPADRRERPMPDDAAPAPSDGPRESLADLLDRASRGDAAAAGAVYDEVAESVYRIAVLMVRDLDEAQDVCRTTFRQVWREWSATRPARGHSHDGAVRSWLLAAAYRGASERARQLSRQVPTALDAVVGL